MSRAVTVNALSLPPGGLGSAGLALLVLLLLTVSPLALMALGWQYGETGGSPIEKFHPATFIAMGLTMLAASARGNPLSALIATAEANPAVAIYLAGVIGLMAHAALVVGLPATTFVDTFILPIAMLFLFRDLSDGRRAALALLVHLLFALNTGLGIAEFAGGFRLTPLYVEGEFLETEWRSSALLGHPLGNACLTGSYMVLLLAGGGRDLPQVLRPLAFLFAAAGMVVFGGRAATAFLVAAIVFAGLSECAAVLRGKRFHASSVLAGLVALPLVALAILGLNELGFFEPFLDRFVDDEGSAGTRIDMLALFDHLNVYDLLIGPDPGFISTLMHQYGLLYGVESFWIAMIFGHGLFVALPFFAALIGFCVEIARLRGRGGAMAVIYFLAVASTSLSLSAKSPIFGILVMLILLLGHDRTVARPQRGP